MHQTVMHEHHQSVQLKLISTGWSARAHAIITAYHLYLFMVIHYYYYALFLNIM